MSDPENRDPWEVPPATHPGELYTLAGGYVMRGEDDPGFLLHGDASGCSPEYPPQGTDLAVLRRLVHCRNLIDGPEEYAERCEGEEYRELDRDTEDLRARLAEQLARRIVQRATGWNGDDGLLNPHRADLLASCREEIARWAEPDDQDAAPARPDASLSPEDADRGGE